MESLSFKFPSFWSSTLWFSIGHTLSNHTLAILVFHPTFYQICFLRSPFTVLQETWFCGVDQPWLFTHHGEASISFATFRHLKWLHLGQWQGGGWKAKCWEKPSGTRIELRFFFFDKMGYLKTEYLANLWDRPLYPYIAPLKFGGFLNVTH